MASPLAVYKLTILYMLDRTEGELPVPELSAFLLENGYAGFAGLMQTYSEMQESGLVLSREEGEKASLRITEIGRETLGLFSSSLSSSIKKQADQWLRKNRFRIRSEKSMTADYYRMTSGNYEVRLAVTEKQEPVIDLKMTLPDLESAQNAVRNWKQNSEKIYQCIVENLL